MSAYNREHQDLPLRVSFGWATAHSQDITLQEVFTRADKNMYQDKMQRTKSTAHWIVRALLTALTAKDFGSEGHVSRVVERACGLGKLLNLSKNQLSELRLLAEVHDLGKVGIPDRILFKEGLLTENEREEIQEHSTIGYRIAMSSSELLPVAKLILHHHEWWNGSGYPSGLKAKGIPLNCRILAIADAFDAMTNDRPYRKAMSLGNAIHELRSFAGIQFDPYLVKLFISIILKPEK